jgi:aspartyl-tRNA(Asn)/glutamyl-tRNA(Gln) amidotransferase subunit B
MAEYFERCMETVPQSWNPKEQGKTVANWILGEFSRMLNAANSDATLMEKKVSPAFMLDLIRFVKEGRINLPSAKAVFEEMYKYGKSADAIIKERGLSQISDTGELEKVVTEVINSNTQAVADYRAGKETAVKFLVGQVMKATKGRANPQLVNEVLKQKLAGA